MYDVQGFKKNQQDGGRVHLIKVLTLGKILMQYPEIWECMLDNRPTSWEVYLSANTGNVERVGKVPSTHPKCYKQMINR